VSVRRPIAAALAVVALGAAPGAALAQSGGAGDDQYVDPFGGSSQQHSSGSKGSSGNSTTGPALSSAPSLSASSTSTPAAPAAAPGQTLPRTGMDAGLVAALGLMLLGAGAAIRLRLRDERL
jgi:hypothetical protein